MTPAVFALVGKSQEGLELLAGEALLVMGHLVTHPEAPKGMKDAGMLDADRADTIFTYAECCSDFENTELQESWRIR